MNTQNVEQVNLTFTHTEDEYVSAARFFYATTLHTKFTLGISIIAIVCGPIGVLLTGNSVLWFCLMFAGLILAILSYYAHFVTPRRHFQRNPKFREQYNLQFSENGLIFRSKDLESKLEWSFYSKVWETQQFYYLIYGKDMFTLIPKRVFTNKEQEALFRSLLKRKIHPTIETYNVTDRGIDELEEKYTPPLTPPDWR